MYIRRMSLRHCCACLARADLWLQSASGREADRRRMQARASTVKPGKVGNWTSVCRSTKRIRLV
jgi:hypothetical protein